MEYTPGVVRSRDRGVTWEAADRGLPSLYTFQVIVRDGAHLAAQWDGVYLSRDAGLTWEKRSEGLPAGSAITELLVTPQGVLAAGGPARRRH